MNINLDEPHVDSDHKWGWDVYQVTHNSATKNTSSTQP